MQWPVYVDNLFLTVFLFVVVVFFCGRNIFKKESDSLFLTQEERDLTDGLYSLAVAEC